MDFNMFFTIMLIFFIIFSVCGWYIYDYSDKTISRYYSNFYNNWKIPKNCPLGCELGKCQNSQRNIGMKTCNFNFQCRGCKDINGKVYSTNIYKRAVKRNNINKLINEQNKYISELNNKIHNRNINRFDRI